ncbi:hypothetical protein MTO96_040673, partial [Rhipicephalus appendiculatus]
MVTVMIIDSAEPDDYDDLFGDGDGRSNESGDGSDRPVLPLPSLPTITVLTATRVTTSATFAEPESTYDGANHAVNDGSDASASDNGTTNTDASASNDSTANTDAIPSDNIYHEANHRNDSSGSYNALKPTISPSTQPHLPSPSPPMTVPTMPATMTTTLAPLTTAPPATTPSPAITSTTRLSTVTTPVVPTTVTTTKLPLQPGSLLCTIGQGFDKTTYTFPPDGLCTIITFDSLYREGASLAPPYAKDFEYFLETAKKAKQSEFGIAIHNSIFENATALTQFVSDPSTKKYLDKLWDDYRVYHYALVRHFHDYKGYHSAYVATVAKALEEREIIGYLCFHGVFSPMERQLCGVPNAAHNLPTFGPYACSYGANIQGQL